jgi:hypothetical protein
MQNERGPRSGGSATRAVKRAYTRWGAPPAIGVNVRSVGETMFLKKTRVAPGGERDPRQGERAAPEEEENAALSGVQIVWPSTTAPTWQRQALQRAISSTTW